MSTGKVTPRPMEYPYTLVSKLTHFPWKMYWKHANWRYRWAVIGLVVSSPVFIAMHNALNSPGNYEKLRLVKEKEHKEHLEHLKHLR